MNRPAQQFKEATERLDRLVREASVTEDEEMREVLLTFVVIKLHDQWDLESYQIVLKSYGRSDQEMIESLRYSWGQKPQKKDWKIAWHAPVEAIRAAEKLNVPDFVQIRDALGSVTCADDLSWTRNAIVHSASTELSRYKGMALDKYFLQDVAPYRLPIETNAATGNLIYEDWRNELGIALQLAL